MSHVLELVTVGDDWVNGKPDRLIVLRAEPVKRLVRLVSRDHGETRVSNVEPPLDLTPAPVRVHFPFQAKRKRHVFDVRVSAIDDGLEITRRNNRVEVRLATPDEPPFVHSDS